jgi:uncharacterized protein (DUF1697 family)
MQYVALLRGINVGGHKAVSMSAFRDFMTELGFSDVKTLLQSGNVIFSGPKLTTDGLEKKIETASRKQLAIDADVMIRTGEEWLAAVDANPFADMAKTDPSHLVMLCLKSKPAKASIEKLCAVIKGREEMETVGRELYVKYPDGIGTSKLTNTVIEKCLATRGTARNWNTVLKIKAALDSKSQ